MKAKVYFVFLQRFPTFQNRRSTMLYNDPARRPPPQAPFSAAELAGVPAPGRSGMIVCDRGLGRQMNRDELHDWMQEVTGPHFDAARFAGKWASLEHLDPAARQRDFLKWLRSRPRRSRRSSAQMKPPCGP